MIASIKEFFSQFIEPGIASQANRDTEFASLHIATAALLLEMTRMDDELKDEERQAIVHTLQTRFKLDAAQIEILMALAAQEARASAGLPASVL